MKNVKSFSLHLKKLITNALSFLVFHRKPLHFTHAVPFDETNLDAMRGLIELRGFHPSASASGAGRNDAATSDKDKQICFMLMPRTGFNKEEFRLE